jgi:cobalt-precorrin-7 (C5)-methyltransferase
MHGVGLVGKLYIVGAGPGSPDYITTAAQKAVEASNIVVGAQRSLNLFSNAIKGESVVLTAKNVDSSLKYAADAARTGKVVAVLSTGDPGFSGLLGSMLRRSLDKTVELTVVAGVSSLQIAAARLCISWDDAVFFAFHDQIDPKKKQNLVDAVDAGKTVLALPEPKVFSPSDICVYLLNAGVNKQTRVVVCENLTLPNERIIESTLTDASEQRFASLSVIVIQPKSNCKLECNP